MTIELAVPLCFCVPPGSEMWVCSAAFASPVLLFACVWYWMLANDPSAGSLVCLLLFDCWFVRQLRSLPWAHPRRRTICTFEHAPTWAVSMGVLITEGCSGRGVQWIGVVLYSKLVYNTISITTPCVSTAPPLDESWINMSMTVEMKTSMGMRLHRRGLRRRVPAWSGRELLVYCMICIYIYIYTLYIYIYTHYIYIYIHIIYIYICV